MSNELVGTSTDSLPASITMVRDEGDPGDETQRNFRYQHAWGANLLISSAAGRMPYSAIWCEHHEDVLAECSDGTFVGYQIKTRQRESGDWKLGDAELRGAIRHLTKLVNRFPSQVKQLVVLSNARFFKTDSADLIKKSPIALRDEVRRSAAPSDIGEPFRGALDGLVDESCNVVQLFRALKIMEFMKGPERESFDSELAHDVLPQLPLCRGLTPVQLNDLRDEIVFQVFNASSLGVTDPARHWWCLSGGGVPDPILERKRIRSDEIGSIIADRAIQPFRYLPVQGELNTRFTYSRKLRMQTKLNRAGLASQMESWGGRVLATERRLLEMAQRDPSRFSSMLGQLVSVVTQEYDEAYLTVEDNNSPFGRELLLDVRKRLRELAKDQPNFVENQPYECLMGVAGLLTGDCRFWWGPQFRIDEVEE